MSSIFDWLAVILFCAISVTFLQRSISHDERRDPVTRYLPAALGSAGANWLGNEGFEVVAYAVLVMSTAYFVIVLKPFRDFLDEGAE